MLLEGGPMLSCLGPVIHRRPCSLKLHDDRTWVPMSAATAATICLISISAAWRATCREAQKASRQSNRRDLTYGMS